MKKTFEMIRMRHGNLMRVEGYHIPSPKGFKFLTLFVHRELISLNEQSKDGQWNMTDLHTGAAIDKENDTRQGAIDHIDIHLKKFGRRCIKEDFENIIAIHGDILADEKKKTENIRKGETMRLTKTNDTFDNSTGINAAKSPKAASKKSATKKSSTKTTKKVAIVKSAKKTGPKKAVAKKSVPMNANKSTGCKPVSKKAVTRKAMTKKVVPEKLPKGQKRCSRCKTVLKLDAFAKLMSAKDGKLSHCRTCEQSYQSKRRQAKSGS